MNTENEFSEQDVIVKLEEVQKDKGVLELQKKYFCLVNQIRYFETGLSLAASELEHRLTARSQEPVQHLDELQDNLPLGDYQRLISENEGRLKEVYSSLLDFTVVRKVCGRMDKASGDIDIKVVPFDSFDKEFERLRKSDLSVCTYVAANPSQIIEEEDIKNYALKKAMSYEASGFPKKIIKSISQRLKKSL